MFDVCDADKSGVVTWAELHDCSEAAGQIFGMKAEEMKLIFAYFDSQGDDMRELDKDEML